MILRAHNIKAAKDRGDYTYLSAIHIFPGHRKDIQGEYRNSPDVAVLEMKKEVTYGPTLNRVCLPSPAGSLQTYEGRVGRVSGWGLLRDNAGSGGHTTTKVLQKAYIPVIANSECKILGKYEFLQK